MGTHVIRTKTDEANDALTAIRDAEQELARWRQHIERAAKGDDSEGFVFQALNSGHIVEASVEKALTNTRAMRSIHLAETSS